MNMPSFDIVSEVNLQEVDNAVNQAVKEISTRFDFRGGKSTIEFDKAEKKIKILADDELKLRSIHQLLEQKLVKRSVDLRLLDYGKQIEGAGNALRQEVTLKNGIDKEEAKIIIKLIKDSKIKVQAQIQDEQVRVTGKSIDDLQETIRTLRAAAEIGLPLQFINMRS
jgi:uncharacterized protein YajQ (UPF0234 family)